MLTGATGNALEDALIALTGKALLGKPIEYPLMAPIAKPLLAAAGKPEETVRVTVAL